MATDKTHKIPNAPNLRFPEFEDKWKNYKVSELLNFFPTNSLSWEQLEYDIDSIQNLHYGLIHVGLPTSVNLKHIKLPCIKNEFIPRNYELCKNGDIAFADASEDTNDVAKAIEFTELDNKMVVCGLHTIHGRDKGNLTISGFKGYAFASPVFHNQIRRIAQGTKVFSISNKNFDECIIGIPSKEEQRKIADLFTLIDDRIQTQIGAIEAIESLITGITSKVSRSNNVKQMYLKDLLTERTERNADHHEVYSVSVSEGVVNQVEYLGRSFAAADTSHYCVARCGDLIYTKSPTGSFPYGIVKRSDISEPVAVSPLYGVYRPLNDNTGIYLHQYFCSAINAHNYLHKLIQKGAKNTINITNQRFLENTVPIPDEAILEKYVKVIDALMQKLKNEKCLLESYRQQKFYLLKNMFV